MKQLFLLFIFISLVLTGKTAIKPTALTCEYMNHPTVVDVKQPRLGWINVAGVDERGQVQSAWQIRVASSKDKLGSPDLWDSGKREGNHSSRVEYNGKPLQSRQDCWWQVRVWDKNGTASAWSEPAFWRMGFLNNDEWKASWIGAPWQGEEALPKPMNPNAPAPEQLPPPAPFLRKEFSANKKISKAVAYVTGLGYFELYLNGQKVGDDVLVPNQTNYGKRPNLMEQNIPLPDDFREYKVMYLAYDVKDLLQQGPNAMGAILGNGFYNPSKYWAEGYGSPRFLLQMHITYADGTEEVIVSDKSWKASKGPILMDMVYYGEHYDARLELDNWNKIRYDDSKWEPVALRKAPEGMLVAHTAYPDKVVERLKPIHMEQMYNGNYKIDFGEEVSGWVKLDGIEGPEGHKIEIRYLSNTYSGDNSYIFSGKDNASYAPRFNWFIFREVEVVNWPGVLSPEQVTAEVVNTFVEESAEFETSNQLFNQINKIWKRTQTDNMHGGIASDCPHRERSPYTGDGQVACITVMHNFDTRNFYHKWIQDIIGAQIVKTGYVPNGAPWQPGCGGGVAWGAAISIMPWEFYLHYGSKDILKDSYPAMKEYIRYMQTWVNDKGIMHMQRTGRDGNVLKWFNLGEWVTPGDLPPDELVHTFYLWRCADITAKTAEVLGNAADAIYYAALAKQTSDAFHLQFYNEQESTYGDAGANVFALLMGVPENRHGKVVAALKKNVIDNKGHLDTGIFGTQFFFEVLSDNGLHELAYEAMNKRDEPSYGRWIELGATTTWEKWDTDGSHNHPMFGGGLVWLYRKLAGMNADPNEPGYRHIIFKPMPADDLEYVSYYNNTSFGKAGIDWRKNKDAFNVNVSVPVGCRATVYVPANDKQTVYENGKMINNTNDLKLIPGEPGYKVFLVNSGDYRFEVK